VITVHRTFTAVDDLPQDNMLNYHQPQSGATRSGVIESRRFMPYGTSAARPNVYGTAEAGASNQMPLPILYDTPQITQPTGGTPEATADAETNQTTTEEEKTPVSDFYCPPIPRVTDCLFGVSHPEP